MRSIIFTAGIIVAGSAFVLPATASAAPPPQSVGNAKKTIRRVVVETGKTRRVRFNSVPLDDLPEFELKRLTNKTNDNRQRNVVGRQSKVTTSTQPRTSRNSKPVKFAAPRVNTPAQGRGENEVVFDLIPLGRKTSVFKTSGIASTTSARRTLSTRRPQSDEPVFDLVPMRSNAGIAPVNQQPFVAAKRIAAVKTDLPQRPRVGIPATPIVGKTSAIASTTTSRRNVQAKPSDEPVFDLVPLTDNTSTASVSRQSYVAATGMTVVKTDLPQRPRINTPTASTRDEVVFDLAPLPEQSTGFASLTTKELRRPPSSAALMRPSVPVRQAKQTKQLRTEPVPAVRVAKSDPPARLFDEPTDKWVVSRRPEQNVPRFLSDLEAVSRRAALDERFQPPRNRFSLASRVVVDTSRSVPNSVDELFVPIGQVSVFDNRPSGPTDSASAVLVAEVLPSYYGSTGGNQNTRSRGSGAFAHRPLYFEELNLERCGTNQGAATTAYSFAKFVGRTATLPYRMARQGPTQMVASGYDCQTGQQFPDNSPFDSNAGAVQAAAITGLIFLIP